MLKVSGQTTDQEWKMDKLWLRDTLERALWTFVQGALAVVPVELLASGDLTAANAAFVGGVAAVLSLVKSVAATKIGDPHSASTSGQVWTASGPDSQ
jgi:hypothetical protein